MIAFFVLSLFIQLSGAIDSNKNAYLLRNSPNSDLIKQTENHSLKSKSDLICNENNQELQIDNKIFQNSAKITDENGCQSINIFNCTFTNIIITSASQENGQLSIIYIKSVDFFIDDSSFSNCYSNVKITRIIPPDIRYMISDYTICHAIYINENFDHEVNITSCSFIDNGISDEADGSIIYCNKVDKIKIEFSTFESNSISSRAFEALYTKDIDLSSNSFTRMKGPTNQNGGALLIQFADNITITDCIFDSNTLQLKNGQDESSNNISGSAFFINLNSTLVFVNNTIMNHIDYLNSVVIFNDFLASKLQNESNLPINRKVTLDDSKYIQNSYSKSDDGNGIGIFIEDYAENDTNFLLIEFSSCLFENNGNNECSASVFEWTRKTSCFSFINCSFVSNTAKLGSFLLDIKNSASLRVENCLVEKLNGCGFYHFTPFSTDEKEPLIKEVEISIEHTTFIGNQSSLIGSDLMITENETIFNFYLNIFNCSFYNISLNSEKYIIKSNSSNLMISSCSFINEKGSSSNAIMSTKDGAKVAIIDSEFTNCLSSVYLSEIANKTQISNCSFIDCNFNPVIYVQSSNYLCENCGVLFTDDSANVVGMKIDSALSIEIIQSNFTNTGNSAIESDYDMNTTSITVSCCTITGCKLNTYAVHTSNKIVNFIRSTICNEIAEQGSRGLFVDSVAEVVIDECTFIKCNNPSGNNFVGGAVTCLNSKPNPRESYNIRNSFFTGCIYRCGAVFIQAQFNVPQFRNVTISDMICAYSIIVLVPQITDYWPRGQCSFDGVSFINITNEDNTGGGIGLWFQPNITGQGDFALSFTQCHFERTRWTGLNSNNYGGGAISIESPSCRMFQVSLYCCSFYHCYSNSCHGSAIAIITNKMISITSCYIEDCEATGSYTSAYGGAIYANQMGEKYDFTMFNVTVNGSLSNSMITAVYFTGANGGAYKIDRCRFSNCHKLISAQSSLVQVLHDSLRFECVDTIFSFDELSDLNSRAVDVHTPVFRFHNCFFTRCGKSGIYGGGINYEDSRNIELDETIEITYCTFRECTSNNCGAFRFTIYNGLPVIFNNTYINITSSYILALIFSENVLFSTINLEKQFFIRCTNLEYDGGGSGIWISNHRADGNVYPTYVNFNKCDFVECVSENVGGGGFGIGYSRNVQPTELNFNYCNFIGNACKGGQGGGALWISTTMDCRVSSCIFRDNRAGTESDGQSFDGGAIFIRFVNRIPNMHLQDSEFINNSCSSPSGNGHVIYGIYLFAIMVIDQCTFTDNGYGIESPNSMIYTDSSFEINFATFSFTDKSKSFTRAIYSGSSSDISIYKSEFINCSDPTGKACSLYYDIISSKSSQIIEIGQCVFDGSNDSSSCHELYFNCYDIPMIHDCTFQNEILTTDLIFFGMNEVEDFIMPMNYFILARSTFTNCNLNKHFFFNFVGVNDKNWILDEFSLEDCNFLSCNDFVLINMDHPLFILNRCEFNKSTNDNFIVSYENEGTIQIQGCTFNENKINGNSNESPTILIKKSSNCRILQTVFDKERLNNSCIIKVSSSIELSEVFFIDCSESKYSLFLTTNRNEEYGKRNSYSLVMTNCTVNKSGSITIENQIDQIQITDTFFGYSNDGVIYVPESNEEDINEYDNTIQIIGNTFEAFKNYALRIYVFTDINIRSNTIKNCQRNEEDCSPIFELDFKSNKTNHITFEQFIFENNAFNNANNHSLINGGGIGLSIIFPDIMKTLYNEITIDFIKCTFKSNKAVKCGGAFAYIESEYSQITNSTIFASFSFTNCTFKENSCNRLKGHALYLDANNVSIENCVFESHNLLSNSMPADDNLWNLSPEEMRESSVVYISSVKNETVSIVNSTFLNNKASSLFMLNCEKQIFISNSLFKSNEIVAINDTESNDTSSLDNDIMSSCIVTVLQSKESVTIENCSFQNNSESHQNENIDLNGMVKSGSIFVDTKMSFSLKNVSFYDNNINDLILKAYLDVFIFDCQFIGFDSNDSVKGCAAVIESNRTVVIENCDISRYSSIITNFQVLTPIQISSNETCQLTNITVTDVIGDALNVISNQSVTIFNCTFESNNDYSKSNQMSDFFITCYCQNLFSMDYVFIDNYQGAINFIQNTEDLIITNSQISNCQAGIVLQPDSINQVSSTSGSLSIENFTFSELKHAILLHISKNQVVFEKVVFYHCINLENNENKEPIIGLKLYSPSSSSTIELIFDKITFEDNQYAQSSSTNSGGGIGLNISPLQFTTKTSASIEFSSCNFLSNNAINDGGAFCFLDSSNSEYLSISPMTFTSCNFDQNHANGNGGALYVNTNYCLKIEIIDCFFTMNNASLNYGAISIECNSIVSIDSCSFLNNSALSSQSDNLVDSLFLSTSSASEIKNTNFTKSTFVYEKCGYQAFLINKIGNRNEIFLIDSCLFSIINPSLPQIMLNVVNEKAIVRISKSSFTHFFAYNEDEINSTSNSTSNFSLIESKYSINLNEFTLSENLSSIEFYHLACKSIGTIKIDDCCFDTNTTYVVLPNFRKIAKADDVIEGITFVNSTFVESHRVCPYPSIIEDLIDEIIDPINNTDNSNNRKNNRIRRLIIGLVVGAAALVIIIVIIIIVVIVYKKKHKEMPKTIQYNDECQSQMEQEQYDFINSKYDKDRFHQIDATYKPSKVAHISHSDKNSEDSGLEEFDL